MSKSRYIKLFSLGILSVAGATTMVYLNTDLKNPVAGKVSAFIVGGINDQSSGNASVGDESSSESYFSIFNFITNLAPKN